MARTVEACVGPPEGVLYDMSSCVDLRHRDRPLSGIMGTSSPG